ncbi:efflux RND transporter periplasmic adaptor subunit [Oleiharenicola sp. Vm1]|uniref:efflux RND transporter periplasmic adaptor subunit n=1 Tax=Oleiharenicola sp. Vm1 TaxID=3398393 RepID=UPI0039F53AE7
MRIHPRRLAWITLVIVSFIFAARLGAHAGHDHGPQVGDTAAVGPVKLTATARQNLGIELYEAQIVELRKTIPLLARVQAIPERTARMSARIEGQVSEIYVKLGQTVKQGEPLLKLVPRAIDTPAVLLRAPFDGVIMAQNASVGLPFTPETVLVELADLTKVLVRGVAYEDANLANVREGAPVTVQLDFYGSEKFSGAIERIAPALDPETRTFEVYALVANPDLRLKPNLQGSLFVGVGEPVPTVAVPSRAILGSLGALFVFVETEENTFERRAVTTGMKSGDTVEIVEGVLPGDKVVVRGNYQLQFATTKPTQAAPADKAQPAPAEDAGHKH